MSHNSAKSITEDAMSLADPKVFMEAMLSEMRRVIKLELEQVHEGIDQMKSARERQPQNVPNLRRRQRVQPREMRVEAEEPYGTGFDEEDDWNSVVVMEAQGVAEPVFSPIILDANISNVHGHHDLSALLLKSRWDNFSEGVDVAARDDPSIHDTFLAHSWVDHAEEGQFIPQAVLDLEAKFGGFSEDPSLLMASFNADSSSRSIRERRSLNKGSHGGRGGGGSSTRVARGIQANKHTFSSFDKGGGSPSQEEHTGERYGVLPLVHPALCGKEGLSLQDQNGEIPLGNRETYGDDGRPSLEKQKGENGGNTPFVCPALCGNKGLSKKVTNDQYPFGTSGTYERDGRPSQDKQKADGTATYSLDLGRNRVIASKDQPLDNALTHGNEMWATQGYLTSQKDATSLADPKVFIEAMMSEMRRVLKLELEQFHEWIDWMESARERQPQNVPNLHRTERVQ
ncbi:hypothetical protein F0562_015300 [Nyssa sinensis]|uniref:Uncharacterized protein n=1 Tax=Nyssa sinensis TaxID=561372 RepID=A0A5J4ZGY3_9ASTE|nr:hypothetical protein F0562_015300 [Nyssa sinensis]